VGGANARFAAAAFFGPPAGFLERPRGAATASPAGGARNLPGSRRTPRNGSV
jgi:hypothetical protein